MSELVEKCSEFEPNKRIEFKLICNLIEEHLTNLAEQSIQSGIEYETTTTITSQEQEYGTLSSQQNYNDIQQNNMLSAQQNYNDIT